jgi:hypothetical protein
MTDPTWTVDDDGDLFHPGGSYIMAGADSTGTFISLNGHADLVRCVRDAALLPAALDVIARLDRDSQFRPRVPDTHWPDGTAITDAERAVLDLAKDRQP